MHCFMRTLMGAALLLAALLVAVPAQAQNELRGFGGPYYRGANNPSAYYRSFGYQRPFRGGAGLGGFGAGVYGDLGNYRGGVAGDAFGRGVAGPFGDYRGYGNYYTSDWYNWRW